MGTNATAACADEQAAEQSLCTGHKCDAVWQCITQSGCAVQKRFPDPFTTLPGIELIDCYCGEIDAADYSKCFGAVVDVDPLYPKGACKQQIETLVSSQDPKVIGGLFNDATSALHALNAYVNCANVNCLTECKCDLSGSSGSGTCGVAGSTNTGGASSGGASSGGTGSGGVGAGGTNAGGTSSGGTNAGGSSAGGRSSGGTSAGGGSSGGASSGGTHSGGASGGGGTAGAGGGGGKGGAACDACAAAHCMDDVTAVNTQCAGGKCDALKQCMGTLFCDEALLNHDGHYYTIDPRECYCGYLSNTPALLTACLATPPTDPQGVCVSQMAGLVGGRQNIASNFSNSATPLGALMNLETCEGQSCVAECCVKCQ